MDHQKASLERESHFTTYILEKIFIHKVVFLFGHPTYFSAQTISPEVLGEFLHVAGETPEGVDLRVKNLQEPAAQVIHSLGITDLWINNHIKWCTVKHLVSLTAQHAAA